MKTRVVNLFGGPGSGKSTLAAELFFRLKERGIEAELIREYVKDWAWRGIKPGSTSDQIYLFAKQVRSEEGVYGKAPYVVTDSPFLLPVVYESLYFQSQVLLPSALAYYHSLAKRGVSFQNFYLERSVKYQANGRYQSEREAHTVDQAIKSFLIKSRIPFVTVSAEVPLAMRSTFILSGLRKP